MKISATFNVEAEVDEMPKTCHMCPFGDKCDQFFHGITKNGGKEWSKAAMTRRHKSCPLKVVD